MKRLAALSLLCCFSAACAAHRPENLPPPPAWQACEAAWVYAPGNYLIDIAAEFDVLLNPEVQNFPLYCDPSGARAALRAEIDAGRLPEGDWRVYRLEGKFADLAVPDATGRPILARMTRMADWDRAE